MYAYHLFMVSQENHGFPMFLWVCSPQFPIWAFNQLAAFSKVIIKGTEYYDGQLKRYVAQQPVLVSFIRFGEEVYRAIH